MIPQDELIEQIKTRKLQPSVVAVEHLVDLQRLNVLRHGVTTHRAGILLNLR